MTEHHAPVTIGALKRLLVQLTVTGEASDHTPVALAAPTNESGAQPVALVYGFLVTGLAHHVDGVAWPTDSHDATLLPRYLVLSPK